jgi:YbbR domain-containing protein
VPETVSVRLRGRRSDLRSISSQLLEVPVDLAWVTRGGTATITLYPQALNVPEDIEVLSIEPNKIQFTVEQLKQSAVTIRPFLYGEVPPGYLVDTPVVEPERALVSGPASQIHSIGEVSTERINITGRTATFTQRVAVLSDSQLVRVIEPLTALVTVPILAPVGPTQPPPSAPAETTTTTTETTATSTQ